MSHVGSLKMPSSDEHFAGTELITKNDHHDLIGTISKDSQHADLQIHDLMSTDEICVVYDEK
jgi:hypothetical protein